MWRRHRNPYRPKEYAYVVISGAKKRDYGDEKADAQAEAEGGVRIKTQEEREELERDAFKRLEGKVEEKEKTKGDKSRIEELYKDSERRWEDPYEVGRRLRRGFRIERKERERVGRGNEALREKMSLGFEILGEEEEDRVRTAVVDFERRDERIGEEEKVRRRALFERREEEEKNQGNGSETMSGKKRKKKKMTDGQLAQASKERLRSALGANTRAVLDPFLNDAIPTATSPGVRAFASIKRRRPATDIPANGTSDNSEKRTAGKNPVLVDYESE